MAGTWGVGAAEWPWRGVPLEDAGLEAARYFRGDRVGGFESVACVTTGETAMVKRSEAGRFTREGKGALGVRHAGVVEGFRLRELQRDSIGWLDREGDRVRQTGGERKGRS